MSFICRLTEIILHEVLGDVADELEATFTHIACNVVGMI